MTEEPATGYEVFEDMSYYDLWAARPVGEKRFYHTAHFETREAAIAWTHDPENLATLAKEISNL